MKNVCSFLIQNIIKYWKNKHMFLWKLLSEILSKNDSSVQISAR